MRFSQAPLEKLPSNAQKLRKSIQNEFGANKAIGIREDGVFKIRGNTIEIKFRESDNYGAIEIYGQPYKKANEYYIDIRLSKKYDQTYLDDERFLHTIKLDELFQASHKNYFEFEVRKNDFALIKLSNTDKGKKMLPVQVIEQKDDDIIVLLNGKKKTITKVQFYEDNFFLKQEEKSLIQNFYNSGGKGQSFVFESYKATDKYNGHYIEILELPPLKKAIESGVVYDEATYQLMQKTLNENKTKLLLTDTSKGFFGLHTSAEHKLTKYSRRARLNKQETVTIAKHADAPILAHELRHSDDQIEGITKKIEDLLDDIIEKNKLSSEEAISLYQVFVEQRAYARQYEYILQQGQSFTHRTYLETIKVSKEEKIKMFINEHLKLFNSSYYEMALETLRSNKWATKDKLRYINFIKKNVYPTPLEGLQLNEIINIKLNN